MGEKEPTAQRTIENESSSSDIVVMADSGGISITLDPMKSPVMSLDVYEEELVEFIRAVMQVAEVALDESTRAAVAGELGAELFPTDDACFIGLRRDRVDHVIHSLEENIDQLYGPREPVELVGGTEIQPTEELSDAQREEIDALEETLELIMEQVTEDDDGE